MQAKGGGQGVGVGVGEVFRLLKRWENKEAGESLEEISILPPGRAHQLREEDVSVLWSLSFSFGEGGTRAATDIPVLMEEFAEH